MGRHYLIPPVQTLRPEGWATWSRSHRLQVGELGLEPAWLTLTPMLLRTSLYRSWSTVVPSTKHGMQQGCKQECPVPWFAWNLEKEWSRTVVSKEVLVLTMTVQGHPLGMGKMRLSIYMYLNSILSTFIWEEYISKHIYEYGDCVNKLSINVFIYQNTLLIWSREEWVTCLLNSWETMVGRIMTPKGVHFLIIRICEYVSLHGKRDFAMWLSHRSWDGKIYPGPATEPNVIAKTLVRGRQKCQS